MSRKSIYVNIFPLVPPLALMNELLMYPVSRNSELSVSSVNSPTESVSREFLIHKRTSLSHTPDIIRVFGTSPVVKQEKVYEFQKVGKGGRGL